MEFKGRLKELRKIKKISQMQLAKAINVSQSAVAKRELGKTEPTASAILALSDYFNESTDYILGKDD